MRITRTGVRIALKLNNLLSAPSMRFPRPTPLSRVGLAVAALWLVNGLVGQTAPDIATLQARVASAPAAEKSAALLALSRAVEAEDMTRAADAAREARKTAQSPHEELLADARLATVLRRRGDYAEAMTVARAGLGRATELGDMTARAELLLVFAQINGSVADYPTAIDAYQQLAALAEKSGDRYMQARGHLGFSFILADTGEPMKAREEEEIVIRIARELGNRELEADGLNNLGNNYRAAREYDRAREAHEQALAIRTAAGNRRGVGDSLVNLGSVARSRGDFAAALDYTQRAFAIYEQLGLKRYQANAHVHFSATLRGLGRPDEALAHLKRGWILAEELKSQLLFADYHREFSLVHEAKGDSQAALEAQRRYSTASAAALGEKSRLQIAALKARYEAEHRERELARLRAAQAAREAEIRTTAAELSREDRLRVMLIDGLLLFVVVGGGLYVLVRYAASAKRQRQADDEKP